MALKKNLRVGVIGLAVLAILGAVQIGIHANHLHTSVSAISILAIGVIASALATIRRSTYVLLFAYACVTVVLLLWFVHSNDPDGAVLTIYDWAAGLQVEARQ